jgi:putative hydrolase of the HAD superfamily
VALRAVLFDAAGTLIELCEPVGDTYSRLAAEAGVDLPAWRLEDAFQRVFRGAPPMVFPDAAPCDVHALERLWWRARVRSTFLAADSTLRFDDFEAFFGAAWRHFAAPSAWRLRPGVANGLAALKTRGLAVGIVSNFDHRLPDILEGLEITEFIDQIVLPSTAAAQKPNPAIFRAALQAFGVRPEQALMVGNEPTRDLEPARRAGLASLDVREVPDLACLPTRLEALATLDPAPESARRIPDDV